MLTIGRVRPSSSMFSPTDCIMSGSASTTTYVSAAVSSTANAARTSRALARGTNRGLFAVVVEDDGERRLRVLVEERPGQHRTAQLVTGRVDAERPLHRLGLVGAGQHLRDRRAWEYDGHLDQLLAAEPVTCRLRVDARELRQQRADALLRVEQFPRIGDAVLVRVGLGVRQH